MFENRSGGHQKHATVFGLPAVWPGMGSLSGWYNDLLRQKRILLGGLLGGKQHDSVGNHTLQRICNQFLHFLRVSDETRIAGSVAYKAITVDQGQKTEAFIVLNQLKWRWCR